MFSVLMSDLTSKKGKPKNKRGLKLTHRGIKAPDRVKDSLSLCVCVAISLCVLVYLKGEKNSVEMKGG